MSDALVAEIEKRLADASLTVSVSDRILRAYLDPHDPSEKPAEEVHDRVFLESVTVEGFRGVGQPLTLTLKPGPGLTLVVGRNGTGKSSLSDALEVLLTGNSARWASKKSKTWQEGWRNLHHPHPTEVGARLVVEGQPGYTTVTRTWAQKSALADGTVTVTVARPGQPMAAFDSLGWQEALRSYRPFLSYSELGGLLEDGPSKLFDALNAILGLEDLSAAAKALARRPARDRTPGQADDHGARPTERAPPSVPGRAGHAAPQGHRRQGPEPRGHRRHHRTLSYHTTRRRTA